MKSKPKTAANFKIMEVRVNGTYSTSTYIKTPEGDTLKIEVLIERVVPTVVVRCTVFKYHISRKKYKCRKYEQICCSGTNILKPNNGNHYSKYISDELLYECFRQHWLQLNPLRIFSSGSLNNKITKFNVTENTDNTNTYLNLQTSTSHIK